MTATECACLIQDASDPSKFLVPPGLRQALPTLSMGFASPFASHLMQCVTSNDSSGKRDRRIRPPIGWVPASRRAHAMARSHASAPLSRARDRRIHPARKAHARARTCHRRCPVAVPDVSRPVIGRVRTTRASATSPHRALRIVTSERIRSPCACATSALRTRGTAVRTRGTAVRTRGTAVRTRGTAVRTRFAIRPSRERTDR
jgi:hypothetical protein